jgi:hypothetical protein
MRIKPLVSHLQVDGKVNKVKEGLDKTFKAFSMKKHCEADKEETD